MEHTLFYAGQALGAIIVILGFINYQVKTRKSLLFVNLATTVGFTLQYLCLGGWSGVAMNIVSVIRNYVFYLLEQKGKKPKQSLVITFAIIIGAIGVLTSIFSKEGLYFILMVVALMIRSYTIAFSNPNHIRIGILITSPMIIIYNFYLLAFGGIVYEAVVVISSIIGFIRFRKNRTI